MASLCPASHPCLGDGRVLLLCHIVQRLEDVTAQGPKGTSPADSQPSGLSSGGWAQASPNALCLLLEEARACVRVAPIAEWLLRDSAWTRSHFQRCWQSCTTQPTQALLSLQCLPSSAPTPRRASRKSMLTLHKEDFLGGKSADERATQGPARGTGSQQARGRGPGPGPIERPWCT